MLTQVHACKEVDLHIYSYYIWNQLLHCSSISVLSYLAQLHMVYTEKTHGWLSTPSKVQNQVCY